MDTLTKVEVSRACTHEATSARVKLFPYSDTKLFDVAKRFSRTSQQLCYISTRVALAKSPSDVETFTNAGMEQRLSASAHD